MFLFLQVSELIEQNLNLNLESSIDLPDKICIECKNGVQVNRKNIYSAKKLLTLLVYLKSSLAGDLLVHGADIGEVVAEQCCWPRCAQLYQDHTGPGTND